MHFVSVLKLNITSNLVLVNAILLVLVLASIGHEISVLFLVNPK